MEMDYCEWIILSDIELNLCIRLLGLKYWTDFPVAEDEQGAEQQILNAFLHLVNIGLIECAERQFCCTKRMKNLLFPVLHVYFKWEILLNEKTYITIYEEGNQDTVIKSVYSQPTQRGICVIPHDRFPEILLGFVSDAFEDDVKSKINDFTEVTHEVEDTHSQPNPRVKVVCASSRICRSAEIFFRSCQLYMIIEGVIQQFNLQYIIDYLKGENNSDYNQCSLHGT